MFFKLVTSKYDPNPFAPISEILASSENNLNALRLIAAVLVLFSYSYALSGNIQLEPIGRHLRIFDGGALAVIAFFFLSGYLISSSWASTPLFLRSWQKEH